MPTDVFFLLIIPEVILQCLITVEQKGRMFKMNLDISLQYAQFIENTNIGCV